MEEKQEGREEEGVGKEDSPAHAPWVGSTYQKLYMPYMYRL